MWSPQVLLAVALVCTTFNFAKAVQFRSAYHIESTAFDRSCLSNSDCTFSSSIGTIFLECANLRCQCKTLDFFAHPMDVSRYEVSELWTRMDPMGNKLFTCVVQNGGPCSTDRGLNVHCQPGTDCIHGKCRHPSTMGIAHEGWFCDDTFDCQPGLTCVPPGPANPTDSNRCKMVYVVG